MSWISKLLGLDNRPTILKALNTAGHTLGTVALEAIPEADLKGRLGGAKVVDAVPAIPQEEGGLAKIYLADELKTSIFAELDRYEPVTTASAAPDAAPEEDAKASDDAEEGPKPAARPLVAGGFGHGTEGNT